MPFAVHTGVRLTRAAPEEVVGHLAWDQHRTTAGNGMHGGPTTVAVVTELRDDEDRLVAQVTQSQAVLYSRPGS